MLYKSILLTLVSVTLAFSSCSDTKQTPAGSPSVPTSAQRGDSLLVDAQPVPVKTVQPTYPELMRLAGVQGTVWLKVLVTKEGTVKDVKLLRVSSNLKNPGTPGGMVEAATDAARRWTFKPGMVDGKPVDVWVAIPFAFKLDSTKNK